MAGLLAQSAVWWVGFLIPAWLTLRLLTGRPCSLDTEQLLRAWLVFGLAFALLDYVSLALFWFPYWPQLKLAFILWLWSPFTDGAELAYRTHVRNLLRWLAPLAEGHVQALWQACDRLAPSAERAAPAEGDAASPGDRRHSSNGTADPGEAAAAPAAKAEE
eukprot:EG_transcript_37665